MADIAEIQLEIKAVKFALGAFADYENEEERRNFSETELHCNSWIEDLLRFRGGQAAGCSEQAAGESVTGSATW